MRSGRRVVKEEKKIRDYKKRRKKEKIPFEMNPEFPQKKKNGKEKKRRHNGNHPEEKKTEGRLWGRNPVFEGSIEHWVVASKQRKKTMNGGVNHDQGGDERTAIAASKRLGLGDGCQR